MLATRDCMATAFSATARGDLRIALETILESIVLARGFTGSVGCTTGVRKLSCAATTALATGAIGVPSRAAGTTVDAAGMAAR